MNDLRIAAGAALLALLCACATPQGTVVLLPEPEGKPTAVTVTQGDKVSELGVKPLAKILGYATFSREPEWFTLAPIGAIATLLQRLSLQVGDVGLFEINEAFSVVPMAAMKELGIAHEKCNVHGGAVALGHPIGASGTRTLVTLLNAMKQRGARIGVDSLCIGGGEAVALAVELC